MRRYEISDFESEKFSEEVFDLAKSQWLIFENLDDEISPSSSLFDRIKKEMNEENETASLFLGIKDKKSEIILGILEYVLTTAGQKNLVVKQLDVHLNPVLRNKVEQDYEEAAMDLVSCLYEYSLVKSFAIKINNEATYPKMRLKIYARTNKMLQIFNSLVSLHKRNPFKKGLSLEVLGRWLEISGCVLTEETNNE